MTNYNNSSNPEFLNNYLVHVKIVKLLAERTIEEYYTDIRLFLRFVYENNHNTGKPLEEIDIREMSVAELRKISISDIYNFIFYTSDERRNKDRARYRKISSLRSFFKYLEKVAHLIDENPTKDLDVHVPKASLPKFCHLTKVFGFLKQQIQQIQNEIIAL